MKLKPGLVAILCQPARKQTGNILSFVESAQGATDSD